MEEEYKKSLQMIKKYKITNEEEYNKIAKEKVLLSSESLKYISQTRDFSRIIRES